MIPMAQLPLKTLRLILYFHCLIFGGLNVINALNFKLPHHEYEFLKLLYNMTNGPSWDMTNGFGWDFSNSSTFNPCQRDWSFIQVVRNDSSKLCHLREILIYDVVSLTGQLPQKIENLLYLETFRMIDNELTGNLPIFRNVPNLKELTLSLNHFTGTIPNDMLERETIQGLTVLDLHKNLLKGSIPAWIFEAKKLNRLSLNDNHFTGTFPVGIINLTSLNTLDLANNQFSGTIPPSLRTISSLLIFIVSNNFIAGTLSAEIMPPVIETFSVDGNNLHGRIPSIFNRFPPTFDISSNYFTGSIPANICDMLLLYRLSRFSISYNSITGAIPSCFFTASRVPSIQEFEHNLLHGKVFIPQSFGQAAWIRFLSLNHNFLSGSFPARILSSRSLRYLSASSNCFTSGFENYNCSKGHLSFHRMIDLNMLYSPHKCSSDSNNPFILTGKFGNAFPQCLLNGSQALQHLSLAGNGFTGSLPNDIEASPSLLFLNLSHNMLRGRIPAWMQRRGFRSLDLSYNKLEGSVEELMSVAEQGVPEPRRRYDMLVLKQNRLSGRLWSKEVKDRKDMDEDRWWVGGGGLKNMSVLDVLEGNMFACEVSRNGRLGLWDVFSSGRGGERKGLVERYDVHGVHYMCEDRVMWMTLELSLLMVVVLVFVILTLLLVIRLYRKGLKCISDLTEGLTNACQRFGTFIKWTGDSCTLLASKDSKRLGLVLGVRAIDAMMGVSLLLAGYLLVIVVPVYVWLHEKGGGNNKYEEVYGWRVSSLFLVGERSGVLVMVLLGVMVVLYMIPVLLNGKRVESGSTSEVTVGARSWRRGKGRSEEAFDRSSGGQSGFEGWEVKVFAAGMYIVVFVLNFAMSMWVNMWYVRWMGKGESLGIGVSGEMELMMVQMGLGLYNVVWNRYVLVLVLRFMRMISKGLRLCGSVCGSREGWWEYEYGLMLLLVNSVIGPWLSVLVVDDSCLSGLLKGINDQSLTPSNPSDRLFLSYDACLRSDSIYTLPYSCYRPTSLTTVPFINSFLCSSKILVLYFPVYISYYTLFFVFMILFSFLVTVSQPQPLLFRTMFLIDFIYREEENHFQEKRRKKTIKQNEISSLALVDPSEIYQQWSCDMTVLLCYGFHDPLRVGLIVSVSMWLEGARWKWLMFRYCSNYKIEEMEKKSIETYEMEENRLEEGIQMLSIINSTSSKIDVTRRKSGNSNDDDDDEDEDDENVSLSDSLLLTEEEDKELSAVERLNVAFSQNQASHLYQSSIQVILVSLIVNGLVLFDIIGEERRIV